MGSPVDTIFALSSGSPPAGVAVIRLSGPKACEALQKLTLKALPAPRVASLRRVFSQSGFLLDEVLVLLFRAPHSFTGEDIVELHSHGSRAVVSALLGELESMDGLRMAEAGEFSRRSFEHGRLDLVEVEGLAELISAETEMQRRLAVEQSFGGQSEIYNAWARRLTHARAMIEAELDFADEDDVPGSVAEQIVDEIVTLHRALKEHVSAAGAGEIIRDGYKVAIVGPPNAGKSSLLNALADRDVAIVTEVAGTTRDVISVDLDLEGFLVKLYDTAGLRESMDVVEQEGIRRARKLIEQADLVLFLQEIGSSTDQPFSAEGREIVRVGSKSDLRGASTEFDLCISVNSNLGISDLRRLILERVKAVWAGSAVPTRKRQLDLLQQASNFIEEALKANVLELRAEYLRVAANSLGRITGAVDVEDLLDVIFSQFCIGK
ncbi:tRNA uridine-5-carboxymethylaminomethyl(34) synthesis GTPase MnmE [Rhizobium halophilum]|uniref:tRNA uridine-5-carboxymethylaminomethyl(34) synthesis GTPase MnmE n=1 Tax=Rhizobium halophilum TaxID=2846852 RepID=UPI001EFD6691|nr:tRNA uridine-5-carboxymethylaminomethyl(34) synthesis GTPase MnmE [Rhizobium halophilum]MCF6369024.1 tRNA uridine-5-carboxymethylaminomethyl(34) synthesis GTPase MnmE [Rhizobium halophilum]